MQESPQIQNVVRCLNELVPTIRQAAETVATFFQEGDLGAGYRELSSLLEALEHFEKGLNLLQTVGLLERSGFADLKVMLDQAYPAILAALENRDSVMLADILQYELAQALAEHRV